MGVDDIREQINDTIMVRPYSSQYKIYIVDEAEKNDGTGPECPLKTIEEPPAYAGDHALTTNPDAFYQRSFQRVCAAETETIERDFCGEGISGRKTSCERYSGRNIQCIW